MTYGHSKTIWVAFMFPIAGYMEPQACPTARILAARPMANVAAFDPGCGPAEKRLNYQRPKHFRVFTEAHSLLTLILLTDYSE